jgi:hypothetical protein
MAGSIYDLNAPPTPVAAPDTGEKVVRSRKRETLSNTDLVRGKGKLADLVDRAFQTLDEAMTSADHATAIKAAQIVLDRAGFGPKQTVDLNTTTVDLSTLSREELAARALSVADRLRKVTGPNGTAPGIVDVTPKSNVIQMPQSPQTVN